MTNEMKSTISRIFAEQVGNNVLSLVSGNSRLYYFPLYLESDFKSFVFDPVHVYAVAENTEQLAVVIDETLVNGFNSCPSFETFGDYTEVPAPYNEKIALENTDFVAELKKRTFFCPDNDTEYSGAEILNDFYEFGDREYYPIDVKGLKSYLNSCLDKNGSLYETISNETAKKYYPLAMGFEPLCGGTRLDCELYGKACDIARSYSENYVVMFERVEIPECKTTGYYFAVNGEPLVFGNMIHNPLCGIWRLDDLLYDSNENHFSIEIIKIN